MEKFILKGQFGTKFTIYTTPNCFDEDKMDYSWCDQFGFGGNYSDLMTLLSYLKKEYGVQI